MARQGIGEFVDYLRRLGAPRRAAGVSDAALVARFVKEQDQAAFEALLGRHGPMIWAVCRRLLFDPHEAEDAFQATWLVFVRRVGVIRQPEQLANWLYGVAHKVAARSRAQALRRQARQHGDLNVAVAPSPDPTASETNRVLHEELDKLPLKYRAPLVLCYLEGRRQEEAAAMLGWSRGMIHGRLERGRNCLRGRLERRGVGLSMVGLVAALEANASAAALPLGLARATTAAVVSFISNPGPVQEAASAAAVALSEGVCRTMQLAKFKLVAVFVLAATLVGGAGLLAGRSTNPATADQPPKQRRTGPVAKQKPDTAKPTTSPGKPVDSWRGQTVAVPQPGGTWQVDWTQDLQEAKRLEIELDAHEQAWADEIAKARRELLVRQERLRQLQQREQEQSRRGRAAEERAEQRIDDARREIAALAASKAKVISSSTTTPEQFDKVLAETQSNLAILRKERERILAENDAVRAREQGQRINARLAVMEAQDQLDRLERRQARKRDQIQGDLELIQERIRRARWGFPPIGAGQDDRLERKVDQLRQQIEDLRRELRHQSSNAHAKP